MSEYELRFLFFMKMGITLKVQKIFSGCLPDTALEKVDLFLYPRKEKIVDFIDLLNQGVLDKDSIPQTMMSVAESCISDQRKYSYLSEPF